jgi:predicted CXXCH cytochrome family protein
MPRVAPVAAALLLLGWTLAIRAAAPAPAPQAAGAPPPPAGEPAPAALGAAGCGQCHAERYAAWTSGRHSRMIQPARAETALGDFSRSRLTLNGRPYALRAARGQLFITESSFSGRPVEHRVEYTLGNRRIQHYLTTIDRGRIVVLPPTWDVQRREWFDSRDIIRPDEQDDNPVQQWNKHCVGCHVSRQDNHYSPAAGTYATTWVDFGTSCERCHGNGEAHMASARGDAAARAGAIVRPTALDPRHSSMICAQCHSLRDAVAPGFRAGGDYYDYFVPKLEYTPRKEQDPVYWADGRPRRFSNDAIGLWQSQCFVKGGATCVTCHDAHMPDVDRHPELAPGNNALCTRCHQALAADPGAHTHHAASSAGSSCVDCHMPREVLSIKAKIRDHSMSLPAPENTVALGIPNACTDCHADKSAAWAADAVARWWPANRRARAVERARVFAAARAAEPAALDGLLTIAADRDEGPLTRANALGYLRRYDDPRAGAALVAALDAEDPVLRTVAASSLVQPAAIPALWRALGDSHRAVRLSALVSLVNGAMQPPAPADRARFARVSAEFAEQARMHEDDAQTQADLGLVLLLNGDLARADEALRISRRLDAKPARPIFLLGLVRLGQQRTGEARALFEQVPASDPLYAAARRQLQALGAAR